MTVVAIGESPGENEKGSRGDILRCNWPGVPFAALALCVSVVLFALEIQSISKVNGWWFDELWSIWATDPSIAFREAFAQRIVNDTTPPLYYVALFWVRCLIADEHWAVVVLNLGVLGTVFTAIVAASRKSATDAWALASAAAFLCSGPVLRYAMEGRSYLMAMAVTFAASWFCALAIEGRETRPSLTTFALVGIIAALTHVYAALICCCLAAGLTVVAYSNRRRDLLGPALALGLPAGIVALVFIAWAMNLVDQASWIEFSYRSILEAYWNVRQLVLGSRLAVVLCIALFAAGSIVPSIRPLTTAFGVAWALFVFIPLLASLARPIIVDRYWLIGAPSLIVFVVFLARAFFRPGAYTGRTSLYWAGGFASLIFLALTDYSAYFQARTSTAEKSIWRGAEFVAPVLQNCTKASVHVNGFIPEFAAAAHVPEALFVDVNSPFTEFVGVSNSSCSVVGWAEHLDRGIILEASNEELLRMLKIGATPSEVNIARHWTGLVVTKRGALTETRFNFFAGSIPNLGEDEPN